MKNDDLDIRKEQKLLEALANTNISVRKKYLNHLKACDVKEFTETMDINEIRMYKIDKITLNKKENMLEKMENVFSTLYSLGNTIFYILNNKEGKLSFYIGIKNNGDYSASLAQQALCNALNGNFPGINLQNVFKKEMETIFTDIQNSKIVSMTGAIPSLKKEQEKEYSQGIENYIESMKNTEYTAVLVAEPIGKDNIERIRINYENLHTQLSAFQSTQMTMSKNESTSLSESLSKGLSESSSTSIANSLNVSNSKTESFSKTENSSTTKQNPLGTIATIAAIGIGAAFAPATGGTSALITGAMVGSMVGSSTSGLFGSKTEGKSTTESNSSSHSQSMGETRTKGSTNTESRNETYGESHSSGTTQNVQITLDNKHIKEIVKVLDKQIERIEASENYGLWNTSAYFLTNDIQASMIAASNFNGLIKGEKSSSENSFIEYFDEQIKRERIVNYVKNLRHPEFVLEMNGIKTDFTPTIMVSGKELPIMLGLPSKSANGLTVMRNAEFARNIFKKNTSEDDRTSKIGKVYNLGNIESTEVELDLDSLTMHTFITGSTGSGKSNTVYTIIDELLKKNIKFLVIEPGKGEYKKVFGGRDGVNVFGTNINFSELLKIDPFSFPETIHVLEHIDRLIEIFNACWPMYAAMPAILKEAVEKIYINAGWDLDNSVNINSANQFPTFSDLLKVLPEVIEKTDYADELVSNYKGSLVTRVKSLTNGICGRIFKGEELDSEILFDQNTIIDISRVGSMETKSLLMGIVFMKLYEHRMANATEQNSRLKHITVMEEAHNLLKRTSTEQSAESSNLQGKSVEMIANSIAEMRTYGEGFMIVDQSPGLLDMSVIRNTNTKMIMRLPDSTDRELVGKASNLDEEQINELAKLETGVASIYQNDWVLPILGKIDFFENPKPLQYHYDLKEELKKEREMKKQLIEILLSDRVNIPTLFEPDDITIFSNWLKGYERFSKRQKEIVSSAVNREKVEFSDVKDIISEIIDDSVFLSKSAKTENLDEWHAQYLEALRNSIELSNREYEESLMHVLLSKRASDHPDKYGDFYFSWVEHMRGGKMI